MILKISFPMESNSAYLLQGIDCFNCGQISAFENVWIPEDNFSKISQTLSLPSYPDEYKNSKISLFYPLNILDVRQHTIL